MFRPRIVPRVGLIAVALTAAASSAHATFIGDLVFCDLNRNGVYEPGSGETALNGVGVAVECRLPNQSVCFSATTTTGTIHSSAAGLTDFFQDICSPSLNWDPDGDIAGRYLVEVFYACSALGGGPWSCTVTVDQSTAPASCPVLVTPLASGPPTDGTGDGDFCDAGDGPFPENQPLGNLPQAFGNGLQTCEQAPDASPGNGVYNVTIAPVGGDDCALYNDFGFAPRPPTQGCTPGYWKQDHHLDSWVPTGYSPNQSLESVFDLPAFPAIGTTSLRTALEGGAGSTVAAAVRILLRAAVAALLGAAHPGVDYPLTTAQVIADANAAIATNNRTTILNLAGRFDKLNNLGCPLD